MLQTIKLPDNCKIAVVGDIHEHECQFDQIVEKIKPSNEMILVSVGDIYDKGYGVSTAESITTKLKDACACGYAYVVKGNHELKIIRKQRANLTESLSWWKKQPLAICFEFTNGSKVTVVHGGVKPSHTWDDLNSDVETCYVRTIDEQGNMIKLLWVEENGKKVLKPEKPNGKIWHNLYDGRFGYVASGHEPQRDGAAKFYNYSCNLDSACYETGILSCQVFSKDGKEELITVSGPTKGFME